MIEVRPRNLVIRDQTPDVQRPCCILCGIWVCGECWDFSRSRANMAWFQSCPKCGGVEGFFRAVRHMRPHELPRRTPFVVPTIGGAVTDEEAWALQEESDDQLNSLRSETMRVPEEANITKELLGDNLPLSEAADKAGLPTLQEETSTPYPFRDGDGIVLGPEVFVADNVISWRGENYYKRQITDEDRKLIAANSKATIERRDAQRRKLEVLHLAMEVKKAQPTDHRSVTQIANDLITWLAEEI